jgi:hypothetical protein
MRQVKDTAQERKLPREARAVFKNSTHSVPKETNFFIKVCEKKDMSIRVQALNKAKTPGLLLTLSEELADRWASRETLTSVAFFRRLEP